MPRQVVSIVRGSVLRHRVLQLGKDLLDRIQVGRVAGQEEQLGAGGADQGAHALALVAAEIIMTTISPELRWEPRTARHRRESCRR